MRNRNVKVKWDGHFFLGNIAKANHRQQFLTWQELQKGLISREGNLGLHLKAASKLNVCFFGGGSSIAAETRRRQRESTMISFVITVFSSSQDDRSEILPPFGRTIYLIYRGRGKVRTACGHIF